MLDGVSLCSRIGYLKKRETQSDQSIWSIDVYKAYDGLVCFNTVVAVIFGSVYHLVGSFMCWCTY
jgi:hypothetical protein